MKSAHYSPASHTTGDRRRSPRLPSPQVLGRLVPSGTPVRVVDVSFGGFLLETDALFEVGSLHQVRLYTVDGSADLVVTAAAIHSRRDSAAAAKSRFITGFSLVGPHHWDAHAQYDHLLDILADALIFD